jgi:hypothetical protein
LISNQLFAVGRSLFLRGPVWWLQLEIDEYGYAVVKTGVEEEEEEEKATGQEWRRQPWYSDEQFFDFLEIPKAAPELTRAHEKEFLLEGAIWKEAARTPWIGDVGEITDPETKKVSSHLKQRRDLFWPIGPCTWKHGTSWFEVVAQPP